MRNLISHGYDGVRVLDNWTKSIVFDAVYQSRLEEGYSDAEAVRFANRAVHDTQPASNRREMATILKGGSASRLFFTQFMNALMPVFNMSFVDISRNLASPSWNSVKDAAWKGLATCLTLYYAQFMKDAISGKLPSHNEFDNGEDDDWGNWLKHTTIDGLINTIPVFNRLADVLRRVSGRKQFKGDDRITEPFTKLANAAKYAFSDDYDEDYRGLAIENFVQGLALIGVPIPFGAIRDFGKIFGIWGRD